MMQPRPTRVLHCLVSALMGAICSLPWASMAVSIAGTMMPTLSVSRWTNIQVLPSPQKPLLLSTSALSTVLAILTAIPHGRATDIGLCWPVAVTMTTTAVSISPISTMGKWKRLSSCLRKTPSCISPFLKSYNRPEFMVEPVKISVDEFSKVFEK